MRAIQLKNQQLIEKNPLEIVDIPEPVISDNEILIRVHVCGICHTDLHIVEGDIPLKQTPLIPGHQIVGKVEKIGVKVTNHKIGDRVGVPWLFSICGECEYCLKGNENLCLHAKFTGYDVNGGFAEFVKVPADFAYKVPNNFSDESAAPLLCAGIIGYRAFRLSNINPGERLGLFGFGASAHITIQVARHLGCNVYVFSRSEGHRKLAENLGAEWTGTPDMIPHHLLHSAISFAPAGKVVPLALGVLLRGGTLALAGIHVSQIPPLDYSLLYHERMIRSVANSTRKDALDFLKIAAEIPIKAEVKIFKFKEINKAMRHLKESKVTGAAVLDVLNQNY